jgi:hypothetical protein
MILRHKPFEAQSAHNLHPAGGKEKFRLSGLGSQCDLTLNAADAEEAEAPQLARRITLNDGRKLLRSTAADEMHDLDAVAVREADASPVGAPDNFAVVLDGETLGRKRELFDQSEESRALLQVLRLAVEPDLQTRPSNPDG